MQAERFKPYHTVATTPLLAYLRIASQQGRLGPPRIGGDHPVVHFRHRTTGVEVERVRWVEWQQDKLLALGQARIFRPEVESPAFLLIQIVEFGYDDGAITCSNKTQNTSLR